MTIQIISYQRPNTTITATSTASTNNHMTRPTTNIEYTNKYGI